MKRTRVLLLVLIAGLAIAAAWLWWVRPEEADMATYAPANSLLYLESDRPLAVLDVLANTETWKLVEQSGGAAIRPPPSAWLQRFVAFTGIGPSQTVVFARAQVAVVVTNLDTTELDNTLKVKPEGALIIQTHTLESRVRPIVEEKLRQLAQARYRNPASRKITVDNVELMEWTDSEGARQILGTTVGSLIIVGNTEKAVRHCIAVAQGREPSLKDDPELQRQRQQLTTEHSLSFGFVPPHNSARLLAFGIPLLLGRAPGDHEIQRLITTGAARVFGSLAWSSQPFKNGIEDRYLIDLEPSIVAQLRAGFGPAMEPKKLHALLPGNIHSATYYHLENPSEAWQRLQVSLSSQTDVLSAVFFSSLLKSALTSYGINEPEPFLRAVNQEVLTLRLDVEGERLMLIAWLSDRSAMREVLAGRMKLMLRPDRVGDAEIFEDSQGEVAATLSANVVVLSSPSDARLYGERMHSGSIQASGDEFRRMTLLGRPSSAAHIITYSDDSNRVRSFISALRSTAVLAPSRSDNLDSMMATLPYSVTETTLVDQGFERVTRSPLGQFSLILPLLIPDTTASSKP